MVDLKNKIHENWYPKNIDETTVKSVKLDSIRGKQYFTQMIL